MKYLLYLFCSGFFISSVYSVEIDITDCTRLCSKESNAKRLLISVDGNPQVATLTTGPIHSAQLGLNSNGETITTQCQFSNGSLLINENRIHITACMVSKLTKLVNLHSQSNEKFNVTKLILEHDESKLSQSRSKGLGVPPPPPPRVSSLPK